MYLLISVHGKVSLEEIDNLKSFSIKQAADSLQSVEVSVALTQIGEPAEDNHYWLDANAIIQLSTKAQDQQWVDAFWQMLKSVEQYGYSDMKKKRLKAHIEVLE